MEIVAYMMFFLTISLISCHHVKSIVCLDILNISHDLLYDL